MSLAAIACVYVPGCEDDNIVVGRQRRQCSCVMMCTSLYISVCYAITFVCVCVCVLWMECPMYHNCHHIKTGGFQTEPFLS